MSSFQPIIGVPKQTHRLFRRTHRVGAELSEFSLSKEYSRNSLPPISHLKLPNAVVALNKTN